MAPKKGSPGAPPPARTAQGALPRGPYGQGPAVQIVSGSEGGRGVEARQPIAAAGPGFEAQDNTSNRLPARVSLHAVNRYVDFARKYPLDESS
eukprot:scaffold1146_cov399-Prasinococcus_capsulatus_cf.AAC.55